MSNSALIDGARDSYARRYIRRPSNFLCLVPVQSASYPAAPVAPSAPVAEATPAPVLQAEIVEEPEQEAQPVEAEAPVPTHDHLRADSTSSNASVESNKRFLKLGPVFWGGNTGEDDYAVEG